MLFLANWFWAFAAIAIPVYLLCPGRLKLYWLLVASAVFHWHFAGPAGVAPIALLGALTYGAGLLHDRPVAWPVWTVVALLVGALVFYKYSGFLLDSGVNVLAGGGLVDPGWATAWVVPAAPLGISFFTFEFVHYLYEVRVHGRAPIRHPAKFAVFAIFFPTLAAGPIKRFPDFAPQLDGLRNPSVDLFASGVGRIITGLFKKVCIADLVVEYVHALEQAPGYSAAGVVLLAVMQGFRIYYDFAGYSDIAIGLAQTLNLRVPENFDRPYFSTSLQEFWRRWHISLSTWIRDYIYIPLGGNRARRAFNLLLAMSLCGLWHGAAWNFAAWGIYHGAGLALEGVLRRHQPALFAERGAPRWLGWLLCYVYVTYGWLLFFYPLGTVAEMTRALLPWHW